MDHRKISNTEWKVIKQKATKNENGTNKNIKFLFDRKQPKCINKNNDPNPVLYKMIPLLQSSKAR
jgi:hypothetical protein